MKSLYFYLGAEAEPHHDETVYLLAREANAERLLASIRQLDCVDLTDPQADE